MRCVRRRTSWSTHLMEEAGRTGEQRAGTRGRAWTRELRRQPFLWARCRRRRLRPRPPPHHRSRGAPLRLPEPVPPSPQPPFDERLGAPLRPLQRHHGLHPPRPTLRQPAALWAPPGTSGRRSGTAAAHRQTLLPRPPPQRLLLPAALASVTSPPPPLFAPPRFLRAQQCGLCFLHAFASAASTWTSGPHPSHSSIC